MEKELLELQAQEDAIMEKLKERLTDLGKSILYKQLTEVLLQEQAIHKQELERIKKL